MREAAGYFFEKKSVVEEGAQWARYRGKSWGVGSPRVWSQRAEKKSARSCRVVRRQFASVEKFCVWQTPEIWIEGVGIFYK